MAVAAQIVTVGLVALGLCILHLGWWLRDEQQTRRSEAEELRARLGELRDEVWQYRQVLEADRRAEAPQDASRAVDRPLTYWDMPSIAVTTATPPPLPDTATEAPR